MSEDSAGAPSSGPSLTLVYVLLAVLAVVLVAVSVMLFMQLGSQDDDISALQADVDALAVDPTETVAAAKDQRKLESSVKLLQECLPEFQTQINTLEVSSGFVSPTDTLSAQCSALVYPNPQGE